MADPRSILLAFLDGLPATIRNFPTNLTTMALGIYPYHEAPDDSLPILRKWLMDGRASLGGYRCAMVCGSIETNLSEDSVDPEAQWTELNERTPSAAFATMAARAPLMKRHLELARIELQCLREGPLSPASLKEWSLRQME